MKRLTLSRSSQIVAAMSQPRVAAARAAQAKAPPEEDEPIISKTSNKLKKTIKPPKSGGVRLLGGSIS